MESVQARLWSHIMRDSNVISQKDFRSAQMSETENLRNALFDEIDRTLNESQSEAFYCLNDITNDIIADEFEAGVAAGIFLAVELRRFLEQPVEAFRKDQDSFPPVSKTHRNAMEALQKLEIKNAAREDGTQNTSAVYTPRPQYNTFYEGCAK